MLKATSKGFRIQCFARSSADRPDEGMNIAGVTGRTDMQKNTLKALGAIESN
jgi:hypothetical protein